MRSDAKASSVGSTMRGSGRLGALSLAVALFAILLVATSAFASKEVVDYIGGSGSGSGGGEFWGPGDVAVNSTGAGSANAGDLYVADGFNNRIQRFDEDGNFISAWGANVLTPPSDEVQTIDVSATAGTYKLSFEGAATADLPYNATASEMEAALRALPASGDPNRSNVFVDGDGPYRVRFGNGLSATDVAQITADTSLLTGTASTATTTQGSGQYEICTVAADCRTGAGSGGANATDNAKNGSVESPTSVAVDGDTGNVYVSDRRNNRVNEYTGDGTFIRSFGFGVDATTAGEGYEVCPAADRCTFGVPGSGAGQIGDTGPFGFGRLGIALSPADGDAATGSLFLADSHNRRVNTYDLDGTNPSSFGSESVFGESQPRKVAVDSRGIVYASNSTGGGEIERYDSEDANGGGIGFLAPIALPPLLEASAESATGGLAVDPDSDGPGPDEDVLYVLRGSSATSKAVVQQFGPVNDPGLTTAPSAVDDTHGSGANFYIFSSGLGVDDRNGHLFVSAEFAGGGQYANRVYILATAPAPAASIDPVTSFDAHSATFSGEVDPNGVLTGYRFEYVDDAEFQANGFTNAQRYPLSDVSAGNGEDPVAVETETPGHLTPGITYHVRLVAKQSFGPAEITTAPVTFTTPGASPSIETVAADVDADSATLRAAINPEGQPVTNYHFEWGTSNAYGSSTTAGSLPDGLVAVPVEAALEGLAPGQTYHYRLVATNATGTTQGPDQTFTTMNGPPQLPQRGYEIASQYPTGGIPVIASLDLLNPSDDGNLLGVLPSSVLANTTLPRLPDHIRDSNVGGPPAYLFSRGQEGWDRTDLGIGGNGWSASAERFLTETRSDALGSSFYYADPRLDPDDRNTVYDVYVWQPGGKLRWISRDPRIPAGTPQTAPGLAMAANPSGRFSMSADGRTVVFKSKRQLLDADTTPIDPQFGPPYRLYKWEDGQLSFIGVRPDGSVPASGSSLGMDGDEEQAAARYAVSPDGSRVIWSAQRRGEGSGEAIYVQTDGQPTVEATKETGVPPLPFAQPYELTYRGAAEDGSRVFFTSSSRFTPDSGAGGRETESARDLYVYDLAADKVRDLTPRLDGLEDPSTDPAIGDRADVLGVAANSSDGKRIYFVANARYPTAPSPEGDLPSASGRNLYLAELDGIDDPVKLRFIATLGAEDKGVWQAGWDLGTSGPGYNNNGKTAFASDDGSVLGFGSTESFTGQPLGGTVQLFVYDLDRGTLDCPSCPSDGSLPASPVNLFELGNQLATQWQGRKSFRRWVSSDGTVFFDTQTALLPKDQNPFSDVYEFRDGALGLVSTGTGTGASYFASASADGSTAFFTTSQTLVPQDKEPGIPKAYAARIGGGFPYVPPPAPCDFNAGACEGDPSTAPDTTGAGSAAFEGPGDPRPGTQNRCPKGKRKARTKGKTRCLPRHHKRHAKHHHKRNAKNDRRASR